MTRFLLSCYFHLHIYPSLALIPKAHITRRAIALATQYHVYTTTNTKEPISLHQPLCLPLRLFSDLLLSLLLHPPARWFCSTLLPAWLHHLPSRSRARLPRIMATTDSPDNRSISPWLGKLPQELSF